MTHQQDSPAAITESDLEELYESAPCGYISARLDGTICRANKTFLGLLGRSQADLLERVRFQQLMTMAGQVFYDTHFGPLIRLKGHVKEIACDLLRSDGSKVPVLVNAVRVDPKDGGESLIRFTIFDATERRRYETDLLDARRRAEHYKIIVQASGDAIFSFDQSGRIKTWNPGAEAIFGYSYAEALTQTAWDMLGQGEGPDAAKATDGFLESLRSGRRIDHAGVVYKRTGELIDVSVSLTPLIEPPGELVGVSAIVRDITERQRIIEVKHQQELLQNLIDSQEAERQRFARDLHDHLGQQLTGLRLSLGRLSTSTSDQNLLTEIEGLKEQASKIDSDLTFIAFELRPNILQEAGLFGAVENFVHEWSRQHNIPATFTSTRNGELRRLSPEIEINLYRITQESLNNVLKHAQANTVNVIMVERDSQLNLMIEDDGLGFSPDNKGPLVKIPGHGLGMLGMRERTAVVGGSFDIESSVGGGSTVFVSVPAVYVDEDPAVTT